MKKILWKSLNPTERLNCFFHIFWLLLLAILIVFLKLDFMVALLIMGVLIICSYLEYKELKRKSVEYYKNKG